MLTILDPAARPRDVPAFAGICFAPEREADRAAADALIDRAFGPGRFAKTAERLREGNRPRLDLSVCAWAGGELAGAVRQWPITIGGARALLLGPFAVGAEHQRQGLGRALIAEACRAADAAEEPVILLVGPQAFFSPLGFERADAARVRMPGPIDPARLLWRSLEAGPAPEIAGAVLADPARVPAT